MSERNVMEAGNAIFGALAVCQVLKKVQAAHEPEPEPEAEQETMVVGRMPPMVSDDRALRRGLAKAQANLDAMAAIGQAKEPEHRTLHAVPEPIRRSGPKIGRNSRCPCGSNLKYKNCCLNKQSRQINTTAMALQDYNVTAAHIDCKKGK